MGANVRPMDTLTDDIHLRRIDPAINMHRFYGLTIQPTLFGGVSVMRIWGRIGCQGQAMIQTYETLEDAREELSRIRKAKLRKGYRA